MFGENSKDADFSTKMLHTTVLSGAVGALLGGTKGVYAEPRATVSAPGLKTVTAQGWIGAAKEGSTFAAVGAVFIGGTAMAESMRGKDDMYNRMIGACAAGTVVGMRTGKASTSAVACPIMAFVSAVVDLTDSRLTPPKEWYYHKHPELVAPIPQNKHH